MQDCFEIGKSSGLLTWVGEIPKETIKNELVQFDVVAYQQNNEDKQISRTVIITFPGDKNGVNFTQSEYQASLTWVSIEYTPPNSEIICGQNVGTKVVCGMILFLKRKLC